ncbi:TPA: hypothetical protein I7671_20935 [Vibrio vulnificus]|nr:hypothetical protein [Vibrio vulnificus]
MRASHLNWALCDKAKFLGFFNLALFGNSFFGVGKPAFSLKFLNHLNRKLVNVRENASLKIEFGRGKFFGRKV